MLEQLFKLAQLLGRETRGGKFPQPDIQTLEDILDDLEDIHDDGALLERQVKRLEEADPNDPQQVVPALIALHLRMDELTSVLDDLHAELKRLIADYPQLEEE